MLEYFKKDLKKGKCLSLTDLKKLDDQHKKAYYDYIIEIDKEVTTYLNKT